MNLQLSSIAGPATLRQRPDAQIRPTARQAAVRPWTGSRRRAAAWPTLHA